MKKLTTFCLFVAILFSCTKKDIQKENTKPETPKEYTVSLGFTSEISINESPLSLQKGNNTMPRSVASNDLYGIQVYSRVKGATTSYNPYAFGIFDNIQSMSIKLLDGYEYKFASTLIIDGKNKIAYYSSYSFPLYVENEGGKLTNSFVLSNTLIINVLSRGLTTIKAATYKNYELPNTDRFYGEVSDYAPAEGGTVNIDLKRVVFGAKFISEGLTDGKLKISIKEGPALFIDKSLSQTEVQEIFTFKNPGYYSNPLGWTLDTYSETIPVEITWEKADGAIVPIATKDITFKRKMLTTVTIKVADATKTTGMNITTETGNLGTGDNVTIEGGGSTTTPVNPGTGG